MENKWGFLKNIININSFFSSGAEEIAEHTKDKKKNCDDEHPVVKTIKKIMEGPKKAADDDDKKKEIKIISSSDDIGEDYDMEETKMLK